MSSFKRLALLVAWSLLAACGPVSDSTLLERSWRGYTQRFVAADGRVIRPEHGGDTVSEGQAYTMLRAVWMDDRATFDRVWRWTRANLARTDRAGDALMAWHWSPADGGRVVDWNVATDADTDLALALVMAGDRWTGPPSTGLPGYGEAARQMLADLAAHAVAIDPDGTRVMLPGAWADQRDAGRGLVLNPSYFSPGAYRVFARVTGDARWNQLTAGSYRVLEALCGGGSTPRPIPDWVRWGVSTGWVPESAAPGAAARSSWDAVRVPWRIATDALWFDAPEAGRLLSTCLAPLAAAQLARTPGLAIELSLDGEVLGGVDHPLANAMHAFVVASPSERDRLLARVRARVVERRGGLFFGEPDRYYVNSLAYLPFLARAGRYGAPASATR